VFGGVNLVLPRQGHLEQLCHVFAHHLKKHHNSETIFDPSNPAVDESTFEREDWMSKEFGHINLDEESLPT